MNFNMICRDFETADSIEKNVLFSVSSMVRKGNPEDSLVRGEENGSYEWFRDGKSAKIIAKFKYKGY